MDNTQSVRRWLLVSLLMVAITGWGAVVVNGDPPKDKAVVAKDAKPLQSAVLRVKNGDLDEVKGILEALFTEPLKEIQVAVPPANPGAGFGQLGGLGGLGALGGIGGGFGGGNLGLTAGLSCRIAVDGRTRSLVVRGSESNLQIARDVVAVIDTPADKPLPITKSLRAFKLKHAEPEELSQLLNELDLKARIVSAPTAKLLIVTGSEEAMKEVADIVKELDVESVKSPNSEEGM